MIYSIFIRNFDLTLDSYKYDRKFIKKLLLDYLYSNNDATFIDIKRYLCEFYGQVIDNKKLFHFLNENFIGIHQKFKLTNVQKNDYERLKKIEYMYYGLQIKGQAYIFNEMVKEFTLVNQDVDYLLAIIFSYTNIDSQYQDEFIFMNCYDIISNFEKYYCKIDLLINTDNDFLTTKIEKYIPSDNLKTYLLEKRIVEVKNLNCFSIEVIMCLFAHDLEKILIDISLHKNEYYYQSVKNDINILFDSCFKDDKAKEFVYRKHGIGTQPETLEKIANNHGLTRERVRQIVKKNITKIVTAFQNKQDVIVEFFNAIVGLDSNYIIKSQMLNYLKDENVVDKMCVICEECDIPIRYDRDYAVFFNESETRVSTLIDIAISKIGLAIGENNSRNLNDFEEAVLKNDYRLAYNNKLFVKKNINSAEIVVNMVDEIFPNGFRTGSDADFELLSKSLETKYGCPIVTNKHAVESDLSRYNYRYIDKGTCINKRYMVKLPDDLVDEINEYLIGSNGIIYYHTLFEMFKERLQKLGINNRYYLKGVLDDSLPPEFSHKRDYIQIGESYKKPEEQILSEIKSYHGIVKLDYIRKKFPGVSDYVFFNYISKLNDVVWIKYMDSFILLENVKIPQGFVDTLLANIEFLFGSLKSKVIVCSKLYARMKLLNSELMNEIRDFDSEFAFFSLVSRLLKGKYVFRRPYIASDSTIDLSNNSLILNYINNLEIFKLKKIQDYVAKMHLRNVGSYLDLFISISDTFVQINMDTAVKKGLFQIPETALTRIKKDLIFQINSFGLLDTRTYNNYSNLPMLKYGWNKYLLVGIVRTFLNDEFIIEYTESMYNLTDFIIRRK